MARSVLVVLVVVLAFSLAPAAPVPPAAKPVLHYPTEVGARLTYAGNISPEWVDEVTSAVWTREGAQVTVRKQVDGEWTGERKVLVSDKGVFPKPAEKDKVGIFIPQLQLPARPDDQWEWEDVAKTRSTVQGGEEVRVPAGTFRTVRVESRGGPQGALWTTEWWALRVGPVKREFYGLRTKHWVLKSFTAGKD